MLPSVTCFLVLAATKYPIRGSEEIMKKKAHGTSDVPVQSNLKYGCDVALADRICNFNRRFAEHAGEENKYIRKQHTILDSWLFLGWKIRQEMKTISNYFLTVKKFDWNNIGIFFFLYFLYYIVPSYIINKKSMTLSLSLFITIPSIVLIIIESMINMDKSHHYHYFDTAFINNFYFCFTALRSLLSQQ